MIALIAFCVAENIGLPGCFLKNTTRNYYPNYVFRSRIQDTAVKELCSGWKTFTLDRRHNKPISRLLDLARLGSPCIHMTKLYRCSRSGGHVTSSTRCIPHLLSLFVGQHHHHYLIPPSAFGVLNKSKLINLCQILRCKDDSLQ